MEKVDSDKVIYWTDGVSVQQLYSGRMVEDRRIVGICVKGRG